MNDYLKGDVTMSQTDLLVTLTANENNSNNVTIAFTMGLKAIEKGHEVEIMLLSDGVHIAEKGYADRIDIGAPFEAIKDVLPRFLAEGGKLSVCSSCMVHNNVLEEDLITGSKVIDAGNVIDALMDAKKTLQLN